MLNKFYKGFDADFPEAEEIGDRMDALFAKLAAVPPAAFTDTIFKQYQLAFSLMVVVDRNRQNSPTPAKIEEVMRALDERVRGFQDLDAKTEEQANIISAFTGGNLHRIRTRKIRDVAIAKAFA